LRNAAAERLRPDLDGLISLMEANKIANGSTR